MGAFGNGDDKKRGKAKAAKSATKLAFGDYKLVRIELTSSEKEDFAGLLADGEYTGLTVSFFLDQGYTVKFSTQDSGKTVVVSITCPVPDHYNAGGVLTARAGDPATALAVAAYKDVVLVADGNWFECEARRAGATPDIG